MGVVLAGTSEGKSHLACSGKTVNYRKVAATASRMPKGLTIESPVQRRRNERGGISSSQFFAMMDDCETAADMTAHITFMFDMLQSYTRTMDMSKGIPKPSAA